MTPLMCLALAVYFEARSEPLDGQFAVAEVVLNRVADPTFPDSVCAVVKQPHQFSFYSDGKPDVPRNPEAWALAQDIAESALSGERWLGLEATFYHATYVSPHWADQFVLIGRVGSHLFYVSDG